MPPTSLPRSPVEGRIRISPQPGQVSGTMSSAPSTHRRHRRRAADVAATRVELGPEDAAASRGRLCGRWTRLRSCHATIGRWTRDAAVGGGPRLPTGHRTRLVAVCFAPGAPLDFTSLGATGTFDGPAYAFLDSTWWWSVVEAATGSDRKPGWERVDLVGKEHFW